MADPEAPPITETLNGPSHQALRFKLVVVSGANFGRELELVAGTYRVGKEPGLELSLADTSVSRVHLVVEVMARGPRITDQNSRNGSFCDGIRFGTIEARPNALITIGRTQLRLLPITEAAPRPPSSNTSFGGLLGSSLPMRQLFAFLERVGPARADVYIFGETGTGKELCARALHDAGPSRQGPFVICDLASLSPSLFESELFGHLKGSFTGAIRDRAGAFERAHRGTLFLDEIGEIPLELQPRLLRFLESRQVKRIGGNDYCQVEARVVAATHRDLIAEVQQGRFRADLYHRLSTLTVRLPPLRDRVDDIPMLVDGLLSRLGKPASTLSAETRALLASHPWPGNVRELRNVVERVVLTGEAPSSHSPPSAPSIPFKKAKERLVTAFERDYLAGLLQRASNNVTQAARDAGLDRVHLYRLLKKHGLSTG